MNAMTRRCVSSSIPKLRQRHYSYDESVDEPASVIEDEAVAIEEAMPLEENEPIENPDEKRDEPPVFEE